MNLLDRIFFFFSNNELKVNVNWEAKELRPI